MLFQHRQRYKGSKVAENAEDKAKCLQLNGDKKKKTTIYIRDAKIREKLQVAKAGSIDETIEHVALVLIVGRRGIFAGTVL